MTPSNIQDLASTAATQGALFPYWAYLLALLVAGVGAYLGAYLRQKALDRANQENFDNVREQLRRSTHDTELIKNAITSKGWISQQAWNQKQKIYADVLLQLTRLHNLLGRCAEQYDPPGAEHDDSIAERPHYIEWSKKISAAFSELEELMGVASIFLPKETVDLLETLLSKDGSAHWWSSSPAEYAQTMFKAVHEARPVVIAKAQHELSSSAAPI